MSIRCEGQSAASAESGSSLSGCVQLHWLHRGSCIWCSCRADNTLITLILTSCPHKLHTWIQVVIYSFIRNLFESTDWGKCMEYVYNYSYTNEIAIKQNELCICLYSCIHTPEKSDDVKSVVSVVLSSSEDVANCWETEETRISSLIRLHIALHVVFTLDYLPSEMSKLTCCTHSPEEINVLTYLSSTSCDRWCHIVDILKVYLKLYKRQWG